MGLALKNVSNENGSGLNCRQAGMASAMTTIRRLRDHPF
jgi:hypothetical protein